MDPGSVSESILTGVPDTIATPELEPDEDVQDDAESDGEADETSIESLLPALATPEAPQPGESWTDGEGLGPIQTKVVPLRRDEFVCHRCYLAKHLSQLADERRVICRDCI